MVSISRRTVLAGGLFSLAGCGGKFIEYHGPEVTRVEVQKANRRMYLLHHDKIVQRYRVQLGFTAEGPKQFEGDGKTPEGRYHIDRRNPNSAYFLSVGIDYPNAEDRAFAATLGKKPGGDIFIHGWGDRPRGRSKDWTAGCVAVTNEEMRLVYAMVRNGTPVDIFA
ncbi:L,D-transpeptidase family protein [Jannaschia seohaensis]|uniref:L,D-transpeptidase catalytic domain n=1 Tax=Jannaschia seohaensis TaxID=475081 RepID=A0A2Y9AZR5_9RHOB|nr:L,D-transpeptidase family protein [Jannaschia seohaensis]PWJ17496.1 L,D-transpeptidase-like protein [Jannaschia seohaensis]SSA47599.1 L,D-transpeptidase catalytic domain [Jannaschia seohaensis]